MCFSSIPTTSAATNAGIAVNAGQSTKVRYHAVHIADVAHTERIMPATARKKGPMATATAVSRAIERGECLILKC